jgi:hypothetical protein
MGMLASTIFLGQESIPKKPSIGYVQFLSKEKGM